MSNERIAELCHEVNRAYCQALGDESQPSWADAPEWQRASAIDGVVLHLRKDVSPAESHASWMKRKLSEGWTYGPEKDPEAKRHPCLVAYDELPREQRVKDHLFTAVVATIKRMAE